MEKQLFALSLGFGLCILATAANAASPKCGPREKVVQNLTEKYGESRKTIGLVPNQGVMETYASKETGKWTIVITLPNGMTCLVAAGSHFDLLDEELPKPSSAT